MNNRLKELVSELGWEEMGADLYGKSMDGCMTISALEKFAELIIQDCVEQIIEKGTDWIDWAPSQTGVRPEHIAMAQHIKKHFGIEK